MPFITKDRRKIIDEFGLSILHLPGGIMSGDRCYVYYKSMVDRWKEHPRWTTVYNLCKEMLDDCPNNDDDLVARDLAWQVFFTLYVIPYELQKRYENEEV